MPMQNLFAQDSSSSPSSEAWQEIETTEPMPAIIDENGQKKDVCICDGKDGQGNLACDKNTCQDTKGSSVSCEPYKKYKCTIPT